MIAAVTRAARRTVRFMGASEDGLAASVIRSGVWVGLASAIQNVLQTGRTIVLAHLLTPEMFGLMGICSVVTRGLELFTETGHGAALIQRQARIEEAKNTAFTLQVYRGIALTALACAVAPLASAYYDEPRLQPLLLVLALAFGINGFTNNGLFLLQKRLEFKRLTILELLVAAIATIVMVVAAFVLRSVWALVIGAVATSLLRCVLSWILIPERPAWRFDRALAFELFGYGRFITGVTIVLFVTTEIDKLIVGQLLGFEWLGYYTIAFTLANLPATHIAKVASRVLFPAYSTIQNDVRKLRSAYIAVLRLVAALALPAAAGLAILAPEIMGVVYGDKWLPAATALRILAVFGAVRAISLLAGYVFQAIGKPKVVFYLVLAKLPVIAVLLPILTGRYGLSGAAAAMTIPQVVFDAFSVVLVCRYLRMPLVAFVQAVYRTCLATLAMSVAVIVLRQQFASVGVLELTALVAVGALVYGILSVPELRDVYEQYAKRRRSGPGRQAPPRPDEGAASNMAGTIGT